MPHDGIIEKEDAIMASFTDILAELKLVRQAFTDKQVWAGLDHGGKAMSLVGQFGESVFGPSVGGDTGPVMFGGAPLTAAVHDQGMVELQECVGQIAVVKAMIRTERAAALVGSPGSMALGGSGTFGQIVQADGSFDWSSLLVILEKLVMSLLQAWVKKQIGT